MLRGHVGNIPFELIDYTMGKGMLVEACSPIGHGRILQNAEIGEIARKYGVSVPQLCIRYVLQLGLLALLKSTYPAQLKSNTEVDFEISETNMETLKGIVAKDYGNASVFPVCSGAA